MLLSYYKRPLFIILIGYIISLYLFFYFLSPIENNDIEEKVTLFCGRVKNYPEEAKNRLKFEFLSDSPVKNKWFIVYLKNFSSISYMDYICFRGMPQKFSFYAIPGNFNWTKYLANKGIFFEIKVDDIISIKKAEFPYNIAIKIRNKIIHFIDINFTKQDENGVINGIVLGEKKKISEKLKLEFQNSGAMHLLVASGSNVGFLMSLFSFFFIKILKIYRRKALLLGLFVTGLYVLAAGLDPPLVRAYIMTIFGTFFLIIERKTDLFQILILSAFLILLFMPRSIFDPGFQMSFLAVYGIIIGISLWGKYFRLQNKFLLYIINLFFVTIFAQCSLFPLLVIYFHKFSLISFLSNMFLVPFSALIMYLVFFSVIFEKINFIFPVLIGILKFAIIFFINLVHFFGSLKYSVLYIPEFNFWGYIFLIVFLFLVFHFPLFGFNNKKAIGISFISLVLFAFSFFIPSKDFYLYFYGCKGIKSGIMVVSNELIVLNPCNEKILNTVLYAGYKRIKAILITTEPAYKPEIIKEMCKIMKVGFIYAPFWVKTEEDLKVIKLWPSETLEMSGLKIRLVWFKSWEGDGYAGNMQEKVRYIINDKYLMP